MKLWLLTQDCVGGYDTYDSCVVAAESEDEAKVIHPSGDGGTLRFLPSGNKRFGGDWSEDMAAVTATLIGTAVKGTESGVICASFNAR